MSRDKHRGNVITSLILFLAFSLDYQANILLKTDTFFFFLFVSQVIYHPSVGVYIQISHSYENRYNIILL